MIGLKDVRFCRISLALLRVPSLVSFLEAWQSSFHSLLAVFLRIAFLRAVNASKISESKKTCIFLLFHQAVFPGMCVHTP